jgi:PAS domain S-box-containing protein
VTKLDLIKWLLPKRPISAEILELLEDFGKIITRVSDAKINYQKLNSNTRIIEQITQETNALSLVSNCEAIYLESFYEFVPLFKLCLTDQKGLVIVEKDSKAKSLRDVSGGQVVFPHNTDWFYLNPISLFFVKNGKVLNYRTKENYAANLEPIELYCLLNKDAQVAVTTSFNYNLLPEKERKRLKIIGEFPLLPEYILVASHKFKEQNMRKIQQEIRNWSTGQSARFDKLGLHLLTMEEGNHYLLLEAIEGLGYTMKKYIEEYDDLLLSCISVNQQKEITELEEKCSRLKNFNDKLIKMYQEVRDSRDRLSRDIESATDNIILFMKSGNIIGCSRSFYNLLKYSRQDLIGKEIGNFIEASIKTPLAVLINQIDVGLVRSFFVKLKISDGTFQELKMEFSIIEQLDSKIIIGMISKNQKI